MFEIPLLVPTGPRRTIEVPSSLLQVTVGSGNPLASHLHFI